MRRVVRLAMMSAVLVAVAALAAGPVPPVSPVAAGGASSWEDTPQVDVEPVPTAVTGPIGSPAAMPLVAPAPAAPSRVPPSDPLQDAAVRARRITDAIGRWASFTLIDRQAHRLAGDRRAAQPTNSESVIKVWLAADLLATAEAQGRALAAWERSRMAAMIQRSDDNAAEVIWRSLGADASIRRMIHTCQLTDTSVYHDWWSLTQTSSRDIARLGSCLLPGPGRPLSARASAELVALMRSVEPSNAFGIQAAHPAGPGVRLAVKNGWTEHGGTGLWNVNCLALWGPNLRWVLAVTVRYPIADGLGYGAGVCSRVTRALFP